MLAPKDDELVAIPYRHFVLKGTEDMVSDYHDYWFHIKGFFIGETLACAVCAIAAAVVQFVL